MPMAGAEPNRGSLARQAGQGNLFLYLRRTARRIGEEPSACTRR